MWNTQFERAYSCLESLMLPLLMASPPFFSIVWSAYTQIIGLVSKPHLDKFCGTCGEMPHCTVMRKRKCKTHETRKGSNYCLAVVRLRKVYFVWLLKDISFTVGTTNWTLGMLDWLWINVDINKMIVGLFFSCKQKTHQDFFMFMYFLTISEFV